MAVVLSRADQAMLDGETGGAAQFAMRILLRFAEAMGAPKLIDISSAHIDGCLYHDQVKPALNLSLFS